MLTAPQSKQHVRSARLPHVLCLCSLCPSVATPVTWQFGGSMECQTQQTMERCLYTKWRTFIEATRMQRPPESEHCHPIHRMKKFHHDSCTRSNNHDVANGYWNCDSWGYQLVNIILKMRGCLASTGIAAAWGWTGSRSALGSPCAWNSTWNSLLLTNSCRRLDLISRQSTARHLCAHVSVPCQPVDGRSWGILFYLVAVDDEGLWSGRLLQHIVHRRLHADNEKWSRITVLPL